MNIEMHHGDSKDDVFIPAADIAFVGAATDDRGVAAHEGISNASVGVTLPLSYDPTTLRLRCGPDVFECDEFAPWLATRSMKSVLLEATTLGFPEVLLLCRAAKECSIASIDFLYVEPRDYSAPNCSRVLHRRDFQLSDEIAGYAAIPGCAFLLDENHQQVVFFCGYEGERLDQAFESLNLAPDRCSVVLGVPAFRAGWEMNTFANVLPVLRDRSISGGIEFCGADNPAAAYGLLERHYKTKREEDRMFVAPIGTKPHGIGAALFATEHDDVGIIYDHPRRLTKRTNMQTRWHVYECRWSSCNAI